MERASFDIGVVGLGVMGRNLAMNIADHGYAVAGLDKNPAQIAAARYAASDGRVDATGLAAEFIAALRPPRIVIILVPAGSPVDAVIADLQPLLAASDILIDAGNSHFRQTQDRIARLAGAGLHFVGMGVSGGEEGARRGPSLMPGGDRAAYERMRPILERIAARVGGEPCVAYLGAGAAGHYVKMVHNGIEYGLMQLIAECYDLLRRAKGLRIVDAQSAFAEWSKGALNSFLIEITARILAVVDPKTDRPLVDLVRDVARQKGTGKWTSQDALELQSPIPTIDAAVWMRDLSGLITEREAARRVLTNRIDPSASRNQVSCNEIRDALFAAMAITFAQGLALLRRASDAYAFGLQLETVARIWRDGCIIRAALLDDVRAAYQANPALPNLLLDPKLSERLRAAESALCTAVGAAASAGIAAPALMASLAYLDALRSPRLPTNLIQAQRDFFGAHQYERIDEPGLFHSSWEQNSQTDK